MNLWGPATDSIRNRRNLAFWSAIWSLIIWPNELIYMYTVNDMEIDMAKALLTYVATIAGTSIGGYLWAAAKQDKKEPKE